MNNEQYKAWGIKGALIVMGFLSLFLFSKTISEFHNVSINDPYLNSINVTGEGEVIAVPDIATFSFTVSEVSETVESAQTIATTKVNKIFDSLKAGGVEQKDLKTDGYNINPEYKNDSIACLRYPCPVSDPVIVGYRVSQNVTVKVRDTAKAGALLTSVGKESVSNVSGLQFVIDDQNVLQDEARSKAIADARLKAKQLAKELGVKLGDVIGYSDGSEGGYPMYDMGMSSSYKMEMANVAPEIPVGENTIVSKITITFEIED